MGNKYFLALPLDCFCVALHRLCAKIHQRAVAFLNKRLMSRFGSCGKGVGLYGRVSVSSAENIRLGNNVHIGNNAYIRAEGGLAVGDNTHISRNLVLYTINHRYEGTRLPYDEQWVRKPVVIGRNVWIGMNVCILPGTTIGDGVIVGMGTVVSGEVPAMSIIGNQQWRVLKWRNEDHYVRLDAEGAYGGPNGVPFSIDAQ